MNSAEIKKIFIEQNNDIEKITGDILEEKCVSCKRIIFYEAEVLLKDGTYNVKRYYPEEGYIYDPGFEAFICHRCKKSTNSYNMSEENQKYIEAYKGTYSYSSFSRGSNIFIRFVEKNNEDFATTTPDKIYEFAKSQNGKTITTTTSNNIIYTLSGIMKVIIEKNVCDARSKVSSEMLEWIQFGTKKL